MPGATTRDRIIIAAVAVLIGAFTLGALGPLVTPASGDDVAGKRDDDAVEVVPVDEEDDEDDRFARAGDSSGGDTSRGTGDSGSRSIGSRSGNTKTGTTNNTGKSKSVSNSSGASKNTATGTTRGTGKSASVSNSS